jgi:TonB family protein
MSRIPKLTLGLLLAVPLAVAGQQPAPTSQTAPDKPADTRPNPDSSGVYHVAKGVTPPKVVYSVDPEFSDKARRKKINGICVVALIVDATGAPKDVHIRRSAADGLPAKFRSAAMSLDKNALNAVSQYRFDPGTFQGKPVPVEIAIEVNFRAYLNLTVC